MHCYFKMHLIKGRNLNYLNFCHMPLGIKAQMNWLKFQNRSFFDMIEPHSVRRVSRLKTFSSGRYWRAGTLVLRIFWATNYYDDIILWIPPLIDHYNYVILESLTVVMQQPV